MAGMSNKVPAMFMNDADIACSPAESDQASIETVTRPGAQGPGGLGSAYTS